jgi:hypothetical protein
MLLFRGTGIAGVGFELRGVNTRHPFFQQYLFDKKYLGSVWSCSTIIVCQVIYICYSTFFLNMQIT